MSDAIVSAAPASGPVTIQRCARTSAFPTLEPESCDVWQIALDGQGCDAELLSAAERTRASGFHFELHRDRFIAGRSALRRVLARYLNVAPGALRLDLDEWGRPTLAPGSDGYGTLDFNVSHSEALAVIAVTRDAPVGIDVETLRPVPDAHTLAARFFTPGERRQLALEEGEALARAFLTCWTRKEALLKSTGVGLRMDPAGIEVGTEGVQHTLAPPGGGALALLVSFGLEGNAAGACAVRASTRILRIFPVRGVCDL